MSNRVLLVAFGLAITTVSTTDAYFVYETSQMVLKSNSMTSEAAELTHKAGYAGDGAERTAQDLR
ncbi:hypothetical protein OH720_18630 [Pseudomonas sp. WJP1]|uniref:hypothetical protein n=1 Tax=Pseudomonas sp. WJP1 TaxID=2986947 RepID=UPI00234A792B|nr:hypothetical protein [Pseudomonas sp. WJP1]WCM49024.1 hypothetical protein OH720_18630 [Pseudomonas sp. WJP1]